MKTAQYPTSVFGDYVEVEYDETAPCRVCKLPVENASVGGTDVCPSCDCGVHRDGTKWSFYEAHLIYQGQTPQQAREELAPRPV